MHIRKLTLVAILSLFSSTAFSEEVAGKWNASMDSSQGKLDVTFDFMIDGTTLTGSMSNAMMGSTPILEGMVNNNEVSFKVSVTTHGGQINREYKGAVKGDTLALIASGSPMPPVEITAMRAE